MHAIDAFVDDARTYEEAEFVEKHGVLFLLKLPSSKPVHAAPSTNPMLDGPTNDVAQDAAFAAISRIAAVRKRPGNSDPERISIGRSRKCDITIRMSQMSKVHAFFLARPGQPLALCDWRSTNGTFVNSARLEPDRECVVRPGDRIVFADVQLDLVDGHTLWCRLRAGL